MTGDDIAKVLEVMDSWQAVVLVMFVGLYALLWKYGKEILKLSRDSNITAHDANQRVTKVAADIQTNHGSQNLGDAVDRLTEWVQLILRRLDRFDERLSKVEKKQEEDSGDEPSE